MSQPKAIFKNTFAQTVANLSTRFSNLVIVFVMARTLHATGIGIYSTAVAYFALIDEATNFGASTYLIREIAKQPAKTNLYVFNFSVMGCVLASIGIAVFWAILPHLGYSSEMFQSMYIIVLAIVPGTLIAIANAVFVAHQRVEFTAISTLISSLLTIVGSLYLLLKGYGVVSLILLFVVMQYLVAVLGYYFINRYITPIRWQFKPRFALWLLWDMRTFAVLSVLGGLMSRPEVIILSLMTSEEQVGYFSAALRIAYLWLFVSQIFMNNVYPVLSRSFCDEDRRFQMIQDKAIKYLLAISLPLSIGMIAAASPIVALFYGPGFEEAVLPLQLLSAGLPMAFIGAVLWRALAARNRQDTVLVTRLISLVPRLGGGFLFVYFLAVKGAAVSATVNLIISMLLLAFFLHRDGISLKLGRSGWRFALAAIGMGLATWLLSDQISIWFLVPLAALFYGILIVVFRAFSPDDYAIFRSIWQPRFIAKD